MRFHVICCLGLVVLLSVAVWLGASTPALCLTIKSPAEGEIVRDKVTIVVPKSSLPSEVLSLGFLVVKIDGRFASALGITEPGAGLDSSESPNVVYIWKSKSPINEPNLPEEMRYYRDGRHEIAIEGYGPGSGGKDQAIEKATVNVVLQNQVPQTDPPTPIKLKYRYAVGQQTYYRFSITGEVLSTAGISMSGGQIPIMGEFTVLQAVEDVQRNGAALLRCKPEKDGFAQLFNQVSMLIQSGQPFKSVYKIIDAAGRTLEDNVLAQRTEAEVTDCLVWLPGRTAQVGETWPTTFRLKLEGICDLTDFTGVSRLEALEWEQGHKCAKIVSTLRGKPSFKWLEALDPSNTMTASAYGYGVAATGPGSPGAGTTEASASATPPKPKETPPVDVTSVAYFAYETGELIKHTMSMTIPATVDSSVIASLQQRVTAPARVVSSDSSGASGQPGVSPPAPGMPTYLGARSTPTSGPGTTTDMSSGGRTVNIKLVVTEQPTRPKTRPR